jgi:hypothetical protein
MAVQTLFVVDVDVLFDQALGILQAKRHAGEDAYTYNRLVPPLQLAIGRG